MLQKAFVTLSGQPDRTQTTFLTRRGSEHGHDVAAGLKCDLAGDAQLVLSQAINALPPADSRGNILV